MPPPEGRKHAGLVMERTPRRWRDARAPARGSAVGLGSGPADGRGWIRKNEVKSANYIPYRPRFRPPLWPVADSGHGVAQPLERERTEPRVHRYRGEIPRARLRVGGVVCPKKQLGNGVPERPFCSGDIAAGEP